MTINSSLQLALDSSQSADLNLFDLIKIDSRIAESSDSASLLNDLGQMRSNKYYPMWTGLIHWFQGNYKQAWLDLAEAAKVLPDEIRIPWYRAILVRDDITRLYWRRYELARHWLNQVLTRHPDFEPALDYRLYLSGYYSQLGQDTMAEDFFSYNPTNNPIFIDAGAFDGISSSNTRRLFEIGWGGVCIEPIVGNYQKLQALYANTPIHCIRCAVSTKSGRERMMVADTGSLLLTDGRQALKGHQIEEVYLFSLNQILEELKINKVDFLSIDCEGVDFDVLQSLRLEQYRPQLIVIEHNSDTQLIENVDTHLKSFGYTFWHDNKQDLFYRASNTIPAPNFWQIKTLLPTRQLNSAQYNAPQWKEARRRPNNSQQEFSAEDLQSFELEEQSRLV